MNFPAEVAGLMACKFIQEFANSTNTWITSELASRVAHYASTHKLALKKNFLVGNFSHLQAVDFLVQATSVSGEANAGTVPKTASNPITTQPPDKSCALPCQKIQPDGATPPDKVLNEDVVLDEDIEQVRHWELLNDLQPMNAHEYESPSLPHVKGRLKSHIQFWIGIQTPDFILDCIRDGYTRRLQLQWRAVMQLLVLLVRLNLV